MTKESMIKVLRYKAEHIKTRIKPEFFTEVADALEQQSEDAISRKWLKAAIHNFYHGLKHTPTEEDIQAYIDVAPSVQPKYNTSEWCHDCSEYDHEKHCCPRYNGVIRKAVEEIKQPKIGYCKDCKYFEYDHFENMGGIPLITAHKVCKRHGLICKTDEDGYCHLWEHKAESEPRK